MESLPVVDFSALSLDVGDDQVDKASAQRTADQLIDAFSNIGFVYLSNTAFPKDLLMRMNSVERKFFDLPTDVKRHYKIRPEDDFGYVEPEHERCDDSKCGDYREFFNTNMCVDLHDDLRWPKEVPDFKQVSLEFYSTGARLAERVLSAIARGLRLPDLDFFKKNHHMNSIVGGTTMRMLYYPPLLNDVKAGQVRLGEHTDYGTITLLVQDDVGGLQVKTRDGRWVDATPIADTIIVNIADLLQRWTSDRLISTAHRVLISEDEVLKRRVRYSTVLFVHPNPDVVVIPLDGSNKYPPITAESFLEQRLQATHLYRTELK